MENKNYENSENLELIKAAIQAGQNAIRSIILINGGAAIAIIALLGHLAGADSGVMHDYAQCLLPFAAGTLLGGLMAGVTYLSQAAHAAGEGSKGTTINNISIIIGLMSYAAFGLGVWWTYQAFSGAL
ncbi:hypothetical protein J2R99_000184 [Rhodopseudomonas julia]|uniref:Uncharacterized protein n=1 Tax=Rhodopseudomonas julia TaxID=200617 RepID=A0ABU0C3S7_9BRAD|nr:hypothetical protein [Rhodopseudomonas julia]MDQ0324335.1 hypothetical protein [Rhodopseudomonas julia]